MVKVQPQSKIYQMLRILLSLAPAGQSHPQRTSLNLGVEVKVATARVGATISPAASPQRCSKASTNRHLFERDVSFFEAVPKEEF